MYVLTLGIALLSCFSFVYVYLRSMSNSRYSAELSSVTINKCESNTNKESQEEVPIRCVNKQLLADNIAPNVDECIVKSIIW